MDKIGKLDRRIVIERNTPSVSSTGFRAESWATYLTLWSGIVEREGTESMDEDLEKGVSNRVFRIRYQSDLTIKDRINYQSKIWEIRSIIEVGRERYLDIACTTRN